VEMKARMTQEPTLDSWGFVGGVIVDDQMERAARRETW
jgi:8-oxo-dGTP pyrophosphatase MutT (NUDIX family)